MDIVARGLQAEEDQAPGPANIGEPLLKVVETGGTAWLCKRAESGYTQWVRCLANTWRSGSRGWWSGLVD